MEDPANLAHADRVSQASTREEDRVMKELGITCETRQTFLFEGYRYDRLADAIAYAEKLALRRGQPEPQAR